MLRFIQTVFLLCAFMALGVSQVIGVKAGYRCDCTGQVTSEALCFSEMCHPGAHHEEETEVAIHDHDHDFHDEEEHTDHHHDDGPVEEEPAPSDDGHRHDEVSAPLVVTTFPQALTLPTLVLFDLPLTFALPEFKAVSLAKTAEVNKPPKPPDGCVVPPAALVVARTIVMLV